MNQPVVIGLRWYVTRGGYRILQFQTGELGDNEGCYLKHGSKSEWKRVPDVQERYDIDQEGTLLEDK